MNLLVSETVVFFESNNSTNTFTSHTSKVELLIAVPLTDINPVGLSPTSISLSSRLIIVLESEFIIPCSCAFIGFAVEFSRNMFTIRTISIKMKEFLIIFTLFPLSTKYFMPYPRYELLSGG